MRAVSTLSTLRDSESAFQDVATRAGLGLDGQTADLALLFSTPHHADRLDSFSKRLRHDRLARHVLACTGESIVGEDQEIEAATALSLWAIRLPDTSLAPFRLTADDGQFIGGPTLEPPPPNGGHGILLLGDPFSFPADEWLKRANQLAPGLPVIGGLASAGQIPGGNRLVLDDDGFSDGAVGVRLDGPFSLSTVVSQGCRPIGRPFIITRADRNLIQELGRIPALERLRELLLQLPPSDQALVRQGLHLGRVTNEYQEHFGRGDFLVRNVIGANDQGAVAISDIVRVGQTVQFHVRDADSADEDLSQLLQTTETGPATVGALLFTCNGRGSRLFSSPNHDIHALHHAWGKIPVAGFFAMGEIGPIGQRNFLHGFTASIAAFGPPILPRPPAANIHAGMDE